jgi:hypothetical protein
MDNFLLQMITKNFEDYPEHRLKFFSLLHAIATYCFRALFALSSQVLFMITSGFAVLLLNGSAVYLFSCCICYLCTNSLCISLTSSMFLFPRLLSI